MLSVNCRRGVGAAALFMLSVGIGLGMTACGNSNNGSSSSHTTGAATDATGSSLIAVDCKRQRAYVPLPDLNNNLHGQVAELDLSVNPDKKNPLIKILDIGEIALPRSATVDIETGTVLVLLDNVMDTGVLLLINEANDSLATVPFPFGSRPSENSGAVINSSNGTALVSMSNVDGVCPTGFGGCTGQAVFDLTARTFGPLLLTLVDLDSFALVPSTEISLASSDPVTPGLFALDVPGNNACGLVDANLQSLNADPDGIAADPTTNIWVAGNFISPLASVINLNGAAFGADEPLDCFLNEGGTPPNSANFDTGAAALGMPGVAINPVTHQAFMTAQGGNQIALLSLPKKPVTQLSASMLSSVSSTIPNGPDGLPFEPANFPYGTNVDSCHNLGYVINTDLTFLAQIALANFKNNAAAIGTALPAGTCAGVTTPFKCDNGKGVKFFQLLAPSTASTADLPGQFSSTAFKARKLAKQRGNTSSVK